MNPIPTELSTLQTPRLVLRAMQIEDAADIFAIYGDAEVMRFTDEPLFPSPETVLQMLESVKRLLVERKSLEWAIELRATTRLIGTCGLHSFDEKTSSAEVGCMLACEYRCKGYMKEALTVVIAYAQNVLGLIQLDADIDSSNERCIRLFESLEFHFDRGTHYARRIDRKIRASCQ
jgi:RimJ/RimL family protein N-acetyltransferase